MVLLLLSSCKAEVSATFHLHHLISLVSQTATQDVAAGYWGLDASTGKGVGSDASFTTCNSYLPCCTSWQYSRANGYRHLCAGMCCGLSSLAAGLCIGVAGDAGVRANAKKDIYVGVILILIFGEALGLYGLIVAIILSSSTNTCT